jgi:Predicted aminopeptidases
MQKRIILSLLIVSVYFSCQKAGQQSIAQTNPVSVPEFNADSAFQYIADQLAFGPRVPNTTAHEQCGFYLAEQLRRFGADVTEQETTLFLQDKSPISIKNIIGAFMPDKKQRILLCAHWDTRPYADRDPNPDNWRKPIDGANDGAGSCAVLLEIARQISMNEPKLGIDIIFFDAEDWGPPHFLDETKHYGSWCMGSEYWSKRPHRPNYTARYGILLDMVSAPNATFYKEYYSKQSAPMVLKKVWEAAQRLGYGNYFIDQDMGGIEDDHIQIIQNRKIPCIDIIQHDPSSDTGFGKYWHTLDDNLSNVSKETMKASGQTVLEVIYNEK